MTERGFIYLVHFESPYRHARHYLGWTRELRQRFYRHTDDAPVRRGAALMRAVVQAKIRFKVVALWPGTRTDERRKHSGGHRRRCPVCRGVTTYEAASNFIGERSAEEETQV